MGDAPVVEGDHPEAIGGGGGEVGEGKGVGKGDARAGDHLPATRVWWEY